MAITGSKVETDSLLLAGIFDRLGLLYWAKTKDGQSGRNKPQALLEKLSDKPSQSENDKLIAFTSGEEFEQMRRRILGKEELWQQK